MLVGRLTERRKRKCALASTGLLMEGLSTGGVTPKVLCSSKSFDESQQAQVFVLFWEKPIKDESYNSSRLAEESTTVFSGDFACGGVQLCHRPLVFFWLDS